MPSHKKLRPRRAVVSSDTENAPIDGAPLPLRSCDPGHPPLHGANGHNRHPAFSKDEKISNLMKLNDTLVKQVSSSRSGQLEMSSKIKSLEELLQSSRSIADALLVERNGLEDERKKFELAVASLTNDVAGLGIEKTALLAEKDELEDALSDLSVSQQQLKEQLEVARKASVSSEDELRALTHDVEALRTDNEKLVEDNEKLADDNEELNEECNGLKSENNEIRSKLKHVRSMEATLEKELSNLRNLYDAEQLKAVDVNKTIEALQAEASSGTVAAAKFEGQLIEASQRIAFLETQGADVIEKQCQLESQVKGLENDLLTERCAHQNAASALVQERRAKEVGILAVACEIDRLRVDKDKLIEESNAFKSEVAEMQVDIKKRQAREVKLEEELVNQRNAHAAAQLKITHANESIKALRDAASSRNKATAKLERQLNDASQCITVFETQAAAAIDRQSELELQITRLESELAATRTELLNVSSALEQERQSKEDEICALTCKLEHLRLDKEKLIEKNNALSAKNTGMQSDLKQRQSKEVTLGNELTSLRSSYSAAQMKINDVNKAIKTLESEVSRRNEDAAKVEEELREASQHIALLESQSAASIEIRSDLETQIGVLKNDLLAAKNAHLNASSALDHERQAKETLDGKLKEAAKFEEQLKEASEQTALLGAQSAASSERQIELETQIRALENDLLASKNAHLSASSALEQELQARSSLNSLLEASQAKSRALDEHLESVKSCLLGKHYKSNTDLRSVPSLQSQLASLVDENKALEETKTVMEKKVSLLNAKLTQASLKAKAESDKLSEQLRQLELALNNAKDEASQRDSKVSRLELDLQRSNIFLEEKSKLVRLSLPVAIVSTSALLFVGLFSYLRGLEEN